MNHRDFLFYCHFKFEMWWEKIDTNKLIGTRENLHFLCSIRCGDAIYSNPLPKLWIMNRCLQFIITWYAIELLLTAEYVLYLLHEFINKTRWLNLVCIIFAMALRLGLTSVLFGRQYSVGKQALLYRYSFVQNNISLLISFKLHWDSALFQNLWRSSSHRIIIIKLYFRCCCCCCSLLRHDLTSN